MKKKITTNHKPINKKKNSEAKPPANNILINEDFFMIFKKFYDSSSKYIQSMKNCLKEININIANNKSNSLDESSNKCISSLNIIFSYLDSSFSQFHFSIHKYFDQYNSLKNSKISNSNKKPILSKNYISSYFYNDNNYKPNSIYNNYQINRIEKNNVYRSKKMNKVNTTTEMKKTDKYNNIEERMGHFRLGSELSSKSNNNILEENNKTFIESVKNLLNVLKYERINEIGNPRKTQYQQKLDKFKENLISELSNSINDKNRNNTTHRRIRSVNLNSDTFNYINNTNENESNKNQINELIIHENEEKNINDYNDQIYNQIKERNKTTENNDSLYYLEKNEKYNTSENMGNSMIDNMKLNYKEIENLTQIENKKLKSENDVLEKNKKELLIQIADLINNNNSLNEEISILKNTNKEKTEIENKSKDIINELNKKIESITNVKNEIEKDNQLLIKSIDIYENKNETQLKEIKQLQDDSEELKKENKNLKKKLNNIENENKINVKTINELKQEIDDLNKEITELVKENEKINNEIEDKNNIKEEYNEKYEKVVKELNDEKQINVILEKKVKNLEIKLAEHNINEYDEGKTKTYKLSNMNKVNEIEVEKLTRKYVSPYNYRKNTSAFSTNNTSNNRKILINNNIDDLEISPENYVIIKYFQLNNKLKWCLLKKIKKQNIEHDPSPTASPSQSNSKHIFRRFKHLKINTKINNENNESFSDFIWKPNKNEKDFINFNYQNADNDNNNNKNENSTSKDWQKKINELEYCIKDLEEKLEKKENDCNRINLNYAKLFKRSKQPELNYDRVLENNEKLKSENRILKKKIENLKSTQNFIGLSFIEDDLEGSRFIDDNCFEEILDGLVGKKNNTYKTNRNDNKLEINILKFFRSHGDDNDNKDINEENNNKKYLNDINNDDNNQKTIKAKDPKIHIFYKNEDNNKNDKNNTQTDSKNYNKDYNKLKTFKRENKNYFDNNNENTNKIENNKDNEDKNKEKNDNYNSENQKSDTKNNSHKKFLSYRYSRYRHHVDNNKNDNLNENKNNDINKDDNKEENIERNENRNFQIKTILKKNFFKNDNENKKLNIIEKTNNDDQINKEKKIYINKLTDTINNNTENGSTKSNNNIFKDARRIRKSYKNYQDINNINNETDYNKDEINNDLYENKNEITKKEGKKENKPYRSLKSMKIDSESKIDKALQESSSQTNRVCRGRRFYKRKQDDINNVIFEK